MHATLKYRIGKLLPAISLMSVLIIPLEAFEVGRDVQFELHTRHKHSGTFEILVADHRRFNVGEPTHFDFRKPTRIVVHGFNSQRKHLIQYTTAFLKKHDCNCIAVNWINGSNTLNYFAARSRVDQVSANACVYSSLLFPETIIPRELKKTCGVIFSLNNVGDESFCGLFDERNG